MAASCRVATFVWRITQCITAMRRRRLLAFEVAALLALAQVSAMAEAQAAGTADQPDEFQIAPFNAPVLPFGQAPKNGLSLSGHLDSEIIAVTAGGLSHQAASDALLQLGGQLDTARAGLWRGGLFEFSIMGLKTNGNLPAQTGALQSVSNDWAANFLRVYQLTYKQDIGPSFVRAGIMDINYYFADVGLAAQLQNASFGPVPTLTANADIATFPTPGLGLMAGTELGGRWSAQAGVWQANPPALSGALRSGALSLLELAKRKGRLADGQAQDVLKLGAWHERQNDPLLGPSTGGVYALGEHRWDVARGPQLGAFVQLAASNGRVNAVPYYVGAGLRVQRPFASRPADSASVGIAHASLAGQKHPETVLELNYAYALSRTVFIQPDLQRIWHPGGRYPGSTVLGVRVHLEF